MREQISENTIQAALALHEGVKGSLLPILHSIQDSLGYVPADAVPKIARHLNLSNAEVHGVISYYHYFRSEPAPSIHIEVCMAEACQARGSDELWTHCQNHTSKSKRSSEVEAVYCLGQCAVGPNVVINQNLKARMTPERITLYLDSLERA